MTEYYDSGRCKKCGEKFGDDQYRHPGPKGTKFEGRYMCAHCWVEVEQERRNKERRPDPIAF